MEEHTGRLILVTNGSDSPFEKAIDIPLSHAEALLELAPGRVDYLSIRLNVGTHAAAIRRFISPDPLDLIVVSFEQDEQAGSFRPLPWFGPEVTSEPGCRTRSIAMRGCLLFLR